MAAIVVTYAAADVIGPCLESLLAQDIAVPVIVVDNASPDGTVGAVRQVAARHGIAAGEMPADPEGAQGRLLPLTLIRAPVNRGFAAGVNLGLAQAMADPAIDLFWIVNPDCTALPGTARAYREAARHHPGAALLGGRTLYHGTDIVQSDGGRLRRWTAVAENVNQGRPAGQAEPPQGATLDFLSGANLVATRPFVTAAGPMPEEHFLYYEEIDWAMRRGGQTLVTVPAATVHHHGGTAAGSGTRGRAPSAFANYFNYRGRMRFAARHRKRALPGAYLYSLAKIAQLALTGHRTEAWGAFLGLNRLPPTRAIRARLAPAAAEIAFGRAGPRGQAVWASPAAGSAGGGQCGQSAPAGEKLTPGKQG